MSEAIFPMLGPLLIVLVVLPLSALITKAALIGLRRWHKHSDLHALCGMRFALLVGSSALPLAWFISASLHQAESGLSAEVCAALHAPETFCAEAAYFALGLILIIGLSATPRLLRERVALQGATDLGAVAMLARVRAIVDKRDALSGLRGRVVISNAGASPIVTLGIFYPRVVLRTDFAAALDDESLAGALHHELEHVGRRDPLRYFLVWWAMAINPLGRVLLRNELERWVLGREMQCDRGAVVRGASPTALAHALICAARPCSALTPGLGTMELAAIKLRVELLLSYADTRPTALLPGPSLRIVALAVLLAVALPHGTGTEPLDTVHQISESALALHGLALAN